MKVSFRPLKSPPREYDQSEENMFRREVENHLLELSALASGAAELTDASASASSKRELFVSPTMTTTV